MSTGAYIHPARPYRVPRSPLRLPPLIPNLFSSSLTPLSTPTAAARTGSTTVARGIALYGGFGGSVQRNAARNCRMYRQLRIHSGEHPFNDQRTKEGALVTTEMLLEDDWYPWKKGFSVISDINEIRTRAGKPTALAGRLLNHSDIVPLDDVNTKSGAL
ncbi:hypothetical protein PCANC_06630 [Puccinia coronata f. sp. avenae]|uniref:Uncharacterized protein n=1 Tax=Puccinia coronata f. sp. avenae TaxID=200324 RepID=A0A2N5T056_9BASI|nr:hypothetical protein PCANC_06630 [Puccinia coronata f. sp. avenae]